MACHGAVTKRVDWALSELLKLRSTSAVVSDLTKREGCSRRTAQRAVKRAHELLVADLNDVDRRHVVAQLEHALFAAANKALEDGQPAVIVGVSRELRALLQLNGVGTRPPSFRGFESL